MISWPMTPPTIAHTGLSSAKQKLSKGKKKTDLNCFHSLCALSDSKTYTIFHSFDAVPSPITWLTLQNHLKPD